MPSFLCMQRYKLIGLDMRKKPKQYLKKKKEENFIEVYFIYPTINSCKVKVYDSVVFSIFTVTWLSPQLVLEHSPHPKKKPYI